MCVPAQFQNKVPISKAVGPDFVSSTFGFDNEEI
jgi:hypothetical protein